MTETSEIKILLKSVDELSPSGFAIAFHIKLTAPDFLFQTYPKPWSDLYSEKGFVMVDPTVRWGFSETGSIRWSDLADLDEEGVLKQSVTFGMAYGVTIATETDNSRSMASFSRADREFTDDEAAALHASVQALHNLTAFQTGMPQDFREALSELAVEMTRKLTT